MPMVACMDVLAAARVDADNLSQCGPCSLCVGGGMHAGSCGRWTCLLPCLLPSRACVLILPPAPVRVHACSSAGPCACSHSRCYLLLHVRQISLPTALYRKRKIIKMLLHFFNQMREGVWPNQKDSSQKLLSTCEFWVAASMG